MAFEENFQTLGGVRFALSIQCFSNVIKLFVCGAKSYCSKSSLCRLIDRSINRNKFREKVVFLVTATMNLTFIEQSGSATLVWTLSLLYSRQLRANAKLVKPLSTSTSRRRTKISCNEINTQRTNIQANEQCCIHVGWEISPSPSILDFPKFCNRPNLVRP